MNSKILIKWRYYLSTLVAIFCISFLGSASAQVVSLTPGSQVDTCDAVDTLWIYFNGAVTGVEAASFTLGYDASYVTPSSVIKSAVLEGNSFVNWTAYPADDSILINVGILTGDFDGPGDFVGIVLSADAEVASMSVTFIRSDLRDANNQSISHSTSGATIQIDCTPPVVTCPGDITQDNDNGVCSAVVTFIPTASDNFTTTPSIVADPASGSTFPVGTTPVEVIATDDAGNADTCYFDVIVEDNENPTITCPGNRTEYVDASCNFSIPDYTGLATGVSDNCTATPTVTQSPAIGALISGHGTVQTITLTADDGNGNTAQCTFDVTLSDNIPPSITCPGDRTEYVDASCNFSIPDYTGLATGVSDNCTATPTVTQSPAIGALISGHGTVQTITLTADDGNGNTAQCTFDVTLSDNIPPSITCPGDRTEYVDASCNFSIPDYTGLATGVSDNCTATPTVTQSPAIGALISGHGTVQTITLTADDGNGNTAQCTFDVTLSDNIPPSITCPGDRTEYVDASCNFSIPDYTGLATGVSDNCTATPTVTQSPAIGALISGHGTVQTITLTADDGNGNTAQCTFDVTLSDNIPPSITCPGDQTLNGDVNCQATLPDYTGLATGVSDNCDPSPTVTQSPTAGTLITGGTTVTLTATDAATNFSNCTFDVTITDITPPTITCPGDRTEYIDASCNFSIPDYTGLATGVSDNCTATPTVTQSPAIGALISGHGTVQTITLTADDGNGNTAQCTFDVTLSDNIPPSITCPGDRTEYVDASCNFSIPDYTGLATGVSDNCTATPTVTQSPAIGALISGHGTVQTITLTADDGNGNTAQCTFDVTLSDNIPPSITCPGDRTEYVDASCNFSIPDYTGLATGVSDNCTATPTVTQSPAIGALISGHGTVQTITLTADDGNGNTAQCTFDVTLSDNIPPSITCPGDRTEYVDASCNFSIPDYTGLATGVSDNCTATPTVTQSPAIGALISGHGTVQTITLTADDGNGNTAQCTFDVTLSDNIPPSITCPGDQTLNGDANCQATLPDYTGLATGVSDNCDPSPTVTQSPTAGTLITGGTTVTLTATDAATNSNNCTFDVTITDITPPTITCPSNLTVGCGESTDPSNTGTATATDNCDPSPVITYSDLQVGNVITRTWTATDVATNSDNCPQTITIDDVSAPTMQTIAEAEGEYYNTAPVFSIFGFGDDCDLDSGFYQIDSYVGSWVSLFADVSGTTWNNNGWTLPGFGGLTEGTHTVYFRATDDVDNVNGDGGELSWQFYRDTEPPAAPTDFTVEPGHNKVTLNWTNATSDFDHTVIMRSDWYSGGHGYPEYGDPGFPAEGSYPSDTVNFDRVYSNTGTSHVDTDDVSDLTRDVYHYAIFTVDAAGNYSAATSAQQGRATSYWLGDVGTNGYDGEVYFEDLQVLSNAYWTSDGDPAYDPEFDIGPTYSGSPKGIPTTDDVVGFEDLVVFAINFDVVSPLLKIAPLFADQDISGPLALSLVMPTTELEVGKEFKVQVLLRNNPGTVKSMHLVLPYDPSQLEFVRADRSDGLKGAPCPVFFDGRDIDCHVDVSLALLGGKISIGGSGEIASITFRLLEESDLSLSFSLIDLRDGENQKLSADQEDAEYEATSQVPSAYELSQNYPNPYNPQTQIAYQLPQAGEVSLKIYNIRGELVRTLVAEYEPAGSHTVLWDGRNQDGMEVSSGIYFYRMVSGEFNATKKMVMIK